MATRELTEAEREALEERLKELSLRGLEIAEKLAPSLSALADLVNDLRKGRGKLVLTATDGREFTVEFRRSKIG